MNTERETHAARMARIAHDLESAGNEFAIALQAMEDKRDIMHARMRDARDAGFKTNVILEMSGSTKHHYVTAVATDVDTENEGTSHE